jgi:hypothetical protein
MKKGRSKNLPAERRRKFQKAFQSQNTEVVRLPGSSFLIKLAELPCFCDAKVILFRENVQGLSRSARESFAAVLPVKFPASREFNIGSGNISRFSDREIQSELPGKVPRGSAGKV